MEFKSTNQTQQNARHYPESGHVNNGNNGNNGAGQSIGGHMPSGSRSSKKWRIIVAVIVIVIIILGAACFGWHQTNGDTGVNTNEYQAVFLSNGQVYFGKLSHINDNYVDLTDIYYLQVQQSVQGSSSTSSNSQVSLAKLGNELHAPEDEMFIAKNQILFWENLKSSGKVVQAIESYQASHPGTE
jgi:hypothetical protein